MLKKKSIVLSDLEKSSNKKAVLSLEEDKVGVRGTLRLYNFSGELPGISSLGFNVNQKVYKAGLTFKSHMLYEFFIDIQSIPEKFSCAVVNFQNALPKPILYGSSEGSADDVFASIITEISRDNSAEHAQNVLDKFDVDFASEEKEDIEKEIDSCLCENGGNCANCVYKKYFFETQSKMQSNEVFGEKTEKIAKVMHEEIGETQEKELSKEREKEEHKEVEEGAKEQKEEKVGQEKDDIFINRLMPQINKLFEEHPYEENLQNLIPSSKWVKVDYEDDGDFYVFGLLYDEEDAVRYVCYGVPAVFEEEPPKELVGFPIWLPLSQDDAQGFGYWLTYQDAVTGEPIKAILD